MGFPDPSTPLTHSVPHAHPAPGTASFTLKPGDLISGKYRLLRMLGAGGMGSVWAARNEFTDRDFAIKFLLPELAQNQEALHRFFLEARACGQIRHPALVNVYDMGQADDGSPYLVMELLEGEGLDQRLSRGSVKPSEAAAWIAFVARGLDEAHRRGLVHRDLKPGNIFFAVDERGETVPKILDFGISKAPGLEHDFVRTVPGAILGSPAYMSPEQARGESGVDGRGDIWSLGIILYEALTGKTPFDGPNYNALMVSIMTVPHRPVIELAPHVPHELSTLVDQLLAKDRNVRVATALELACRLDEIIAKITGSQYLQFKPRTQPLDTPSVITSTNATTASSTWSQVQTGSFKQKSKLIWALAAALGLVGIGGGAFAFAKPTQSVSTANKSSAIRALSLSNVQKRIEEIQKEPVEAKIMDVVPGNTEIEPSSGDTSAHSSDQAPSSGKAKGGSKSSDKSKSDNKTPKDSHGGVDEPGF